MLATLFLVVGWFGKVALTGISMAVIDNGAVVHARGFGNDGHGNQATADTPFWIGSNTKSITALAIMQLAEAGSADLDAPSGTTCRASRWPTTKHRHRSRCGTCSTRPAVSCAPMVSGQSCTPTRTSRSRMSWAAWPTWN